MTEPFLFFVSVFEIKGGDVYGPKEGPLGKKVVQIKFRT